MLNTGKRHYIIRIYESIENNRNVRDSKRPEQKGNKIKINSISQLLPTIYQESQTHCRHEIRFQDRGFGRESRVPVGICGVIFTAFRVKSKSLGSPRRGMGSRRHLARRSVGHLWHFIKWRSWPATERKKDRSGGRGSGKSRRKRGTAQSGFITRWAAESGTELGSSRAATCTSWTRGISLRPGAPWRPFNIGRGRDAIHAPRDALQPLRLIRARARAFRTKRQRKMRSVDAPCSLTSPATAWEATILRDWSNSSKASELTVAGCCT